MPPLSGPRAVQVTRTLAALGERGWRSRVICFGPRSDRYQQDYRVSLDEDSGGTATLVPVSSPEEWLLFRALWRICPPLKHRPDEKRVWMPGALAAARRTLAEEPADVLVSFAQPWTDHLIGLQLHRDTGLPWVAHFSDPWVDSPYLPASGWAHRVAQRFEQQVVAEATKLVFVNRQTLTRTMAKYPATWAARAHVVPQGFVRAALTSQRSASDPEGPQGSARPLRLVYTGRFYDGIRTPETLLEALARLDRESPLAGRLDMTFIGSGMAAYAQRAANLGLSEIVRFPGRLSPQQARDQADFADVLVAIDAPSDGPSLFLPSKLIDYLPARKPILGITPSEGPSADLLRQLSYPIVDPRDVTGLLAAVSSLLERHRDGTLAMSPQHDEVARAYDIGETTREFDRILTEAMQQE